MVSVSFRACALDAGARLVEQRGLLHHFDFAADAALGTDIGIYGVARRSGPK
jgi:hypothetical protein